MVELSRPEIITTASNSADPLRQAPARPTPVLQRRGAERVEAIPDAAEQILGEQGYETATLKAIGERAGIPTASVYHYFSDRYQVGSEIIQLGTPRDEALNDPVQAFDESTTEHVRRLALERGLLRDDTPLLVMRLAFEAGSRLFDVAFQRTPPIGDDATLDEARRLVAAYLEIYAPPRTRRRAGTTASV